LRHNHHIKSSSKESNFAIGNSDMNRSDTLQNVLRLIPSSQDEFSAQIPSIDFSSSLMPLTEESSVSSEDRSVQSSCGKRSTRTQTSRGFINACHSGECPVSIAISSGVSPSGVKVTPSKWFGADVNKYTNGHANVPTFNPGLRKFIEAHVLKARRIRENCRREVLKKIGSKHYKISGLSICSNARIPYPSLRVERSFLFDVETYPLHQILADTIGVEDLSLIHQHKEQNKKLILNPLLNPDSRKNFHECYENFVTSICIPELHSKAMSDGLFNITSSTRNCDPGEICYRYQAFPCLRVMRPGEFSIGPHCDMAYGHSIGNINFHIPLTPTFGTNALYTETHSGREDWHPLTAKSCGLGYIFDGARCLHFSLENTTDRTRVSLDFRIAIYRKSSCRSVRSDSIFAQNYSMEPSVEEEYDDIDDVLCSESILEDNYSIVPGYYDEFLLDVGSSSRLRAPFSPNTLRKNNRSVLLNPDKRNGFPF